MTILGKRLFLAAAFVATSGFAAAAPETRTFDVATLISVIPDFDAPAGALSPRSFEGQDRGSATGRKVDARAVAIERIIALARAQTDRPGDMTAANVDEQSLLTVTAEPAVLDRVAAALKEADDSRGRQHQVVCRIFTLADADAAKLPPALRRTLGRADFEAGRRGVDVDPKAILADVLHTLVAKQITAPKLALFDAQRAYVLVSTDHAYIKDVEVEHGDNGAELKPVMDNVPTGVSVQVQTIAAGDGSAVAADYAIHFDELSGMNVTPVANAGGSAIQKPLILSREASGILVQTAGDHATLVALPVVRDDAEVMKQAPAHAYALLVVTADAPPGKGPTPLPAGGRGE